MDRSNERPTPSGTTGPRSLASVLPNVIGSQRGEIGSAVTPELVEAAKARLMVLPPKETDASLLVMLRQRHGISLEPRTQWMFPNDRPAYKKTMGFFIARSQTSDLEGALKMARLTLLPADTEVIVKGIATLKAKTKSRAQGEMDMGIEIETYEKELRNYPADIALEAMRLAAEQSMWFPAWFEMKEILDRMYVPRQQIVDKLAGLA